MTYEEFVNGQFITRVVNALNGLKNNLVIAGIKASSITVQEVTSEGVNDLRYRLTGVRGNKTLVAYIELTAGPIVDGAMTLIITVWVEGNGNQITTTYTPNQPLKYNDSAALDALALKLNDVENLTAGELLTSARAFLGV